MTRTYDNLSLEIRNNRMTRQEAIEILRKNGTQEPIEDIRKFCKMVGITMDKFYIIIEKFRNKDIWFEESGVWKIKDFLITDWGWSNEDRLKIAA